MRRRPLLQALGAAPGALLLGRGAAAATPPPGVLRVAFGIAPTGFDPPQVSDEPAVTLGAHIFESPFTYDWLAWPMRIRPQTAAALPEVSQDFRRFVVTLQRGILFADDPAFGGRPRELVAADYVYSIKRYYDPRWKSEHLHVFENAGLLGLGELRRRALAARAPFDYDSETDGLRVLDRYRFEIRLAAAAPRFVHTLVQPTFAGAVAREVVERYRDDDLMAHPVGTGPFMLQDWRRGSHAVLVRNPRFREQHFDAEPPADDAAALATAERLRGRRLPPIERIEADFIDETQPRWLAFLNGEHDVLVVPPEYAPLAVPGGTLAPHLARRGVRAQRLLSANVSHTFFNCEDPVVGGYAPPQVALRRAIALACDNAAEVRVVLHDEALPAMSLVPPQTYGYDAALRSELGAPSTARANALLDLYGYADRDRDGWREMPDGRPLRLLLASRSDQTARRSNELWTRRMRAVGLRMAFDVAPFGELIKRSLAGQLMMWSFNWSGPAPDCDFFLGLGYGPNADQSNDARFRLPAYDRLYERQRVLPDGPERLALIGQATRTLLAYMPYLPHYHLVQTILSQPRVRVHRRHPFLGDWGRYSEVGSPL